MHNGEVANIYGGLHLAGVVEGILLKLLILLITL